jgi:tetratricopeptide (TPR) repeat protein
MIRRNGVVLLLVVATLAAPGFLLAEGPAMDTEVVKGIGQVDDGDYDEAILTLDAAARRLSTARDQSADLAQAYLYLGVAYLAKGHEASARLQFRQALAQAKDLNLSPQKFAPKVIEIFNEARASNPPAAEPTAVTAPPPTTGQKHGGHGKTLLIVGGVVGAGAAVAAAAGGGGGGAGSSPTAPGAVPFGFDCTLTPSQPKKLVGLGSMGTTGTIEADVTWLDANVVVGLGLQLNPSPEYINRSIQTGPLQAHLSAPVLKDATYFIEAFYDGRASSATCHVTGTHP